MALEFSTRSSLAVLLLELLAKGDLPATRVARLAAAAAEDGWLPHDPLAQDLAKAGEGAIHTGNCLRDIMKIAQKHGFLTTGARPYTFKMLGPGGREEDVNMFLPTETYHHLVRNTNGDLSHWCLDQDRLNAASGLGATLKEWGASQEVENLNEVAMLGLHCDGATYTSTNRAGGTKSVVVGSINVASAADPKLRGRRHLLFCISKNRLCDCRCSGYHSYQAIFGVLAWNMGHLRRGTLPAQRHDGTAWTSDIRKNRVLQGTVGRAACVVTGNG